MENFINNYFILDGHFIQALIISLLGGFIIGAERELTNKSAGLRTHILVCLGACVFTLLSLCGFPPHANPVGGASVGDPARIAAQIVTGIGFIGGGTVLRHGLTIQGLTTAATLWICAAIGMAAGCGKFSLSLTTTLFAIVALVVIRFVEKRLLHHNKKNYKMVKITATVLKNAQEEVQTQFTNAVKNIWDFSAKKSDENNDIVKITMKAEVLIDKPLPEVYKEFANFESIKSIDIQEILN